MCLGVPAQIIAIADAEQQLVTVSLNGLKRDVNAACVWTETPETLLEQWVLVHVGFALAIVSEQEANETLELIQQMGCNDEIH
ncbi:MULTISPECIES: HypC/HybG/HupF family hydrogenase formation chaperone [Vibrio]|uniref:NiFe-hydrogenase chaperone n=1 Tax=Vibrio halioticoli NBRC 102217 TaxID=1219072 RepID=V5FDD5_9VIBR|nr:MULTISPECIES: HypC/HybG/HupF family hydrogenase formation chaperone [Vibrio]MPW35782.1 HypC/HybG/HupF family hydrogenase formation chaperone [Vibrio sp. B1Z05]GAD89608.1 NiFe-hydrogenase chaperone [Vibrio halioticoli NBRC 102217]